MKRIIIALFALALMASCSKDHCTEVMDNAGTVHCYKCYRTEARLTNSAVRAFDVCGGFDAECWCKNM